jgi:hypothetical protein
VTTQAQLRGSLRHNKVAAGISTLLGDARLALFTA